MSINVNFVEKQIYRAEWQGAITIEEIIQKMDYTGELATEHQDEQFVLIVDLSHVTQIPFDLRNLRKIADSDGRVACFVIVKAPIVGQVLGKMLNNVSNKNFVFEDDVESAITTAHSFITKKIDQQMDRKGE